METYGRANRGSRKTSAERGTKRSESYLRIGLNMEKTLHARYKWTLEECLIANCYFQQARITFGQWISRWFLGLFFICGIFYSLFHPKEDLIHKIWGVIIFSALAFFTLVYPKFRIRKIIRKSFRSSKEQDKEVSLEIKEENVAVEGPLASTKVSWQLFEKAIFTPLGIMLCTDVNASQWLPMIVRWSSTRDLRPWLLAAAPPGLRKR